MEFDELHPDEFQEILKAWESKEARADRRNANLQFIIATSNGVTINGKKPTIEDFLPEYAKPKRKRSSEADLKSMLMGIARGRKEN